MAGKVGVVINRGGVVGSSVVGGVLFCGGVLCGFMGGVLSVWLLVRDRGSSLSSRDEVSALLLLDMLFLEISGSLLVIEC